MAVRIQRQAVIRSAAVDDAPGLPHVFKRREENLFGPIVAEVPAVIDSDEIPDPARGSRTI
jgi:hypothetical protein